MVADDDHRVFITGRIVRKYGAYEDPYFAHEAPIEFEDTEVTAAWLYPAGGSMVTIHGVELIGGFLYEEPETKEEIIFLTQEDTNRLQWRFEPKEAVVDTQP